MPVLIVENGSIVDNANSYVSLAFARSYASDIGLNLATDDDAAIIDLLNANRFLEGLEFRFQGRRVSSTQSLTWPREGVFIGGIPLAITVIPDQLMRAQVIASSLIFSGIDLFPTQSGQFITKRKVDVLETEYSDEFLATPDGKPIFTAVESMLEPLFINSGGLGGYRLTSRIGF